MAKSSNKALVGGGLIGALLLVGAYLGGLFKGPGLGTGPGGGISVNTGSEDPKNTTRNKLDPENDTQPINADAAGDVVNILIDGRKYFLRNRTDGRPTDEAISLAQAVDLAKRVEKGDAAGVKVNIYKRESAVAEAHDELYQALRDAGLTKDDIENEHPNVP